jgi:Ni/Co efflux regulator RcnB
MKIFIRTLLAAVALSVAAAPMAQAQQQYGHDRKPGYSHSYKKKVVTRKKVGTRHSWNRGERYSDWKRRPAVRDYHRHGLRKPSRGQQWVKVDNTYLLMSIATGVILGVTAAR